MKPRLLLVGRRRYKLPLPASEQLKFDAMAGALDVRVLASAVAGSPLRDETFTLVPPLRPRLLDGLFFHASLPFRIRRLLHEFEPNAVLVQGAHDAAAAVVARRLSRSRAKVILDVHGDWRTATRLYGSGTRRVLNPLADRVAAWAVRRVDAVRTVSDFTTGMVRELGVEPAATFPAFMDLDPFLAPPVPLPERPVALFVGALELYKGLDLLVDAWPRVAEQVPAASLRLIGAGAREDLARTLVQRGPNVSWESGLAPEEIADELDAATVPRAPLAARGDGPRRRRGLLPRPGGRGRPRRRDRGSRHPWRERPAVPLGRRRRARPRARKDPVKSRARVRPWVCGQGRIGTVVRDTGGIRGARSRARRRSENGR